MTFFWTTKFMRTTICRYWRCFHACIDPGGIIYSSLGRHSIVVADIKTPHTGQYVNNIGISKYSAKK